MSFLEAQAALRVFLGGFDSQLEVCSDAPEWDWEFFCQLAYVDLKWPSHVENRPTNLIHLFRHLDWDDISNITLPDLPHHALLDARLLTGLYQRFAGVSKRVGD